MPDGWIVKAESFLAIDNTYISCDQQKELYDEGQKLANSINACQNTLPQ
jgi:hypothetical protein